MNGTKALRHEDIEAAGIRHQALGTLPGLALPRRHEEQAADRGAGNGRKGDFHTPITSRARGLYCVITRSQRGMADWFLAQREGG